MKKTISLLVPLALLVGCGKEVEDVKQRLETPNLMHTFATECHGSNLAGLSEKTYRQFSGKSFKEVREFFSGSGECQGAPAARLRYEGEFEVPGDAKGDGPHPIDLKYQKAFVQVMNDTAKNVMKAGGIGLCGSKEWQVGQEKEITADTADSDCAAKDLPRTEYGTYRVEDKAIFFSELKLGNGNDQASKRSSDLPKENVMRVVDRSL